MRNATQFFAAQIFTMSMFFLFRVESVMAQTADDSYLEYCYGTDCGPTKEYAIGKMEDANPDYRGLFEEVDSGVTFENGRQRPMWYTFRVKPLASSGQLPPVYSFDSATNPAPTYCAPSGDPLYPNGCSDQGSMIQGFVNFYIQLYGANHVQSQVDMKGGYISPYAEVSTGGTTANPMGMYHHNNWQNSGQIPTVTVTVYNDYGIDSGHGGSARILKTTTFTCLKGFYAKGGANPGYNPTTSNPTEPGTECRPYIGDKTISTRMRQTACPPIKDGDPTEGNPCSPATGDKMQYEVDFEFAGRSFGRSYHSLGQVEQRNALAPGWAHTYSDRIYGNPGVSAQPLVLFDGRGQIEVFIRQGTSNHFVSESSTGRVIDVEAGNTFTLYEQDGTKQSFNASGRLTRLENIDSARSIDLTYQDDKLISATDQTGRQLQFEYINGRLVALHLPDGRVVAYGYDANNNLQTVQYPDSRTRTYHYNEAGLSDANDYHALTGISENGIRYATFGYDVRNRARLTQHHANGAVVDRVQLTYGSNGLVNVTGSRGETRTYSVVTTGSYRRVSSIANSDGTVSNLYSLAMPVQHTDRLGNVEQYEYSNGYESARIEAQGTLQERKIATVRNAALRITEQTVLAKSGSSYVPKRRNTYTYNTRGQVLSETITDLASSPVSSRTTTILYCEQVNVDAGVCPSVGLLKNVDGPLPGTTDTTIYQYRMSDAPACLAAPTSCAYRKGDLWKITNAFNQVTEIIRNDGAGRILSSRDINNVITEFTYDSAGRPSASTIRGTDDASETDDHIVTFSYWSDGQLKRVTQPDGTWSEYAYDTAKRLTSITDNTGNSITYTLDAGGGRTAEEIRDSTGTLRRSLSRTYNTLGQVLSQSDAYGHVTTFTYDANGNLDQITDALLHVADSNYDALGRVKRTLRDMNGIAAETKYEYDALDNLSKVIDSNGLSTAYTYNGFGDQLQLQSPDTGVTSYGYDAAGRRTSQTDARGVQTQYTYDALNRVTTVNYPSDTTLNVSYTYDTAQADCTAGETFLAGRLAKMTDGSGSTTYCYDRFGELTRKVQRTQGKVFALRWIYAVNGRLQAMVYPDGTSVDYVYDSAGRVAEIGATPERQSRQIVVRDVLYHPFGGPASWRYGLDRVLVRTQNLNGQPGIVQMQNLSGNALPGLSLGYEFDAVGNLKRLRDGTQADPPRRIYGYDGLNRLIEAKDASNILWQSYSYDKTGNRLSAGHLSVTNGQDCTSVPPGGTCTPTVPVTQWVLESYAYMPGTHRLFTVSAMQRSYDAAGNLTLIAPMGNGTIDPPPGDTESASYGGTLQVTDDGSDSAPPGAVARSFGFNAANRMNSTALGGEFLMGYFYNGGNERVYRQGLGSIVYSVFDESSRWAGDYDQNGMLIQQAIFLGDFPVGVLARVDGNTRLFYVEPDALGTARVVVDPSRTPAGSSELGTIVWRWDLAGEAFGNDKPSEDPDNDGTAFVLDMRFPGQQYDSASELDYNYFRDYDPGIGGYVESDPIGLGGGENTYGYVDNWPLIGIDPFGLQALDSVSSTCTKSPATCIIETGTRSRPPLRIVPPPTPMPTPVVPPLPFIPDVKKEEPCDKCAQKYPNLYLCSQLPGDYIYSSLRQAQSTYRYQIRLEKPETTYGGPAKCQGNGTHWKVRGMISPNKWMNIGSITSCNCCVDTAGGPVIEQRFRTH